MVGMESRSLPVYGAGEVDVPFVIAGTGERILRDTRWEEHSHPTHELLWHERGASSATIGSRTWTITPSIGLWIPAGRLHWGVMPAGTWYRAAHFGVDAVTPLGEGPVAVVMTPLLRLLLDRLTEPELSAESRSLTEQMVLDVLAPADHELLVQVPSSPLVRPIVDAIVGDPGDPRTLADWAVALGVSTRTITRMFRAETGLSLGRWIAAVRAQHAVMLLGRGADVDDVAERVGYRSASAFGVAFRRVTGTTPGSFRAG